MFGSVLIANRGEIALRIARTCREMGIRTVAVYSTSDAGSAVARFADQAVHIGPGQARRSYTSAPALIEAARLSGAEAIHPGYGFLSEDPDFAEICAANGITFIGPAPELVAALGDKVETRRLMADAGLPVLPGSAGPVPDLVTARQIADEIGYPIVLKALAGGGGAGVRVVLSSDELQQAYPATKATALALFGDGRVYIERFLRPARHVEVQVLCDVHGNAVHLGERDCSVQRRHQKLIEEAPAPGLPADVVAGMREAAVRGALAVGYTGVGTFEFLVGPDNKYFLIEVNCRLQVEHPVTELITGIDLVREQLRVAAGEPLSISQGDVELRGVAIECRVTAEDPARDFAPAPGLLEEFHPPGGPFVRVDTHAHPGYRIPADYDSLLAKTIVWAPDRDQALARMSRALGEFRVSGPGVRTGIGFLAATIEHPRFRNAEFDTSLVETVLTEFSQLHE